MAQPADDEPLYPRPMPRWPLALSTGALVALGLLFSNELLRLMAAPAAATPPIVAVEAASPPALETPPSVMQPATDKAAPTIKQVQAHADALTRALKLRPTTTYTARVSLRRIRRELEANPDAATLARAADDLDAWERTYLRTPRTGVLEAGR